MNNNLVFSSSLTEYLLVEYLLVTQGPYVATPAKFHPTVLVLIIATENIYFYRTDANLLGNWSVLLKTNYTLSIHLKNEILLKNDKMFQAMTKNYIPHPNFEILMPWVMQVYHVKTI